MDVINMHFSKEGWAFCILMIDLGTFTQMEMDWPFESFCSWIVARCSHQRGMVVYILVVKRSTFFPLSQLMIHGVIVASHGDALHWGLNKFDAVDFTQEVWSFVVPGTWDGRILTGSCDHLYIYIYTKKGFESFEFQDVFSESRSIL